MFQTAHHLCASGKAPMPWMLLSLHILAFLFCGNRSNQIIAYTGLFWAKTGLLTVPLFSHRNARLSLRQALSSNPRLCTDALGCACAHLGRASGFCQACNRLLRVSVIQGYLTTRGNRTKDRISLERLFSNHYFASAFSFSPERQPWQRLAPSKSRQNFPILICIRTISWVRLAFRFLVTRFGKASGLYTLPHERCVAA